MNNFRLVHLNFKEKYKLQKAVTMDLSQVILDYHPDIISAQNINDSIRRELEEVNHIQYHMYEQYGCRWSSNTILNKRSLSSFETTYSLKQNILKQVYENMPVEDGNCQVSLLSMKPYWLSFVNTTLDSIFSPGLSKEMLQLGKFIDLYQGKDSSYYTRYQIVAGDFGHYRELEDFCSRHNLIDLSVDVDPKTHILVSDSLDVKDIEVCKVKAKNRKEGYATIVNFETKKN